MISMTRNQKVTIYKKQKKIDITYVTLNFSRISLVATLRVNDGDVNILFVSYNFC